MLATDSTAASVAVPDSAVETGVAAALMTTVDCWFTDGELADPERSVRALPAEFGVVRDSPCGASVVAASPTTSENPGSAGGAGVADCSGGAGMAGCSVGDAAAGCSTGDAAAGCSAGDSAVGCSTGDAVATAEGTPVWVGVASADSVVSLLDVLEPVRARGELCTAPERGSAVEA
jgi:hypothetical protein